MKPYTGDLARPGTLPQALEVSMDCLGRATSCHLASCASAYAAGADICAGHAIPSVLTATAGSRRHVQQPAPICYQMAAWLTLSTITP